jgi:hypothetical protein
MFGGEAEPITPGTGRDACGIQRLAEQVFRRDAGNCTRGRVRSPDPDANGLGGELLRPAKSLLPMLLEISFERSST